MNQIEKKRSENALIIFVKEPKEGKVKTRLGKTIGHHLAVEIYKELLEDTLAAVKNVDADFYIYYQDQIIENDLWNRLHPTKKLQINADLGDKMEHAFKNCFQNNYKKVAIIGSDCPNISTKIIKEAFDKLEQTQVAIGPAEDGGYYLLAKNRLISQVFKSKKWSTSSVFRATVQDLQQSDISYTTLSLLSDIDTEQDLLKFPKYSSLLEVLKKM